MPRARKTAASPTFAGAMCLLNTAAMVCDRVAVITRTKTPRSGRMKPTLWTRSSRAAHLLLHGKQHVFVEEALGRRDGGALLALESRAGMAYAGSTTIESGSELSQPS